MSASTRATLAYRLVLGFTLWALAFNGRFLLWSSHQYFDVPLDHPLFPAFFESPFTFLRAYLTAVSLLAFALVAPPAWLSRLLTAGALVAVSILCLHLGSYNDATFTTAWWALVWAVWFGGQVTRTTDRTVGRGARLALAIAALSLLGGAVGKWTPEYWSGQVLYEIHFSVRDISLFNYLRNTYDASTLREVAMWHSRAAVAVESIGAVTLWLLPLRVGAVTGLLIFVGITAFSNPVVASATLSMIGMASVGLLAGRPSPSEVPLTGS